jgi:uncharacterized protein
MSQTNSPSKTPMDVLPRHMEFPYAQMQTKDFFDNNCLKSAYIAAMSATFPAGEGEFIKSVRMFRDQVEDEDLKQQIKGFIGQEAHHSLQHKRFNEALREKGYDAVRLEGVFEKDLAWSIKSRKDKERLGFTVCVEHMTAVLAYDFLTKPERMHGMDPSIKPLMLWHAVEELEHKSVAFDLYMQVVGNRKFLHRAMRVAMVLLSYRFMKYSVKLLWWAKRRPSWREMKGFWKFLYGKGGLMRAMAPQMKDFFRDDFHPWDQDDTALIDKWKAEEYKTEFDLKAKQAA